MMNARDRLYNLLHFSIYTLDDLGDLSNLIGSLSRTIQQYSPPSKWIMWEIVFFFQFFQRMIFLKHKQANINVKSRRFGGRQNLRVDLF